MRERATFGPVMLLGLATAGFSAVAGNQRWAEGHPGADVAYAELTDGAQVPLAPALSLALLAVWGLLLVLRGRARRSIAMIGVLVALAALGTVIAGRSSLIHHYDEIFAPMGTETYRVSSSESSGSIWAPRPTGRAPVRAAVRTVYRERC